MGPPIFIVGNGRSGTTLMELMLSAHPRIYICHEVEFYRWLRVGRNLPFEDVLRGYLGTMNFLWQRFTPELVLHGLPSPLQREEAWMVMDRIMRLKSASLGRVRYGDKTPAHTPELGRIYRDFPDARVILMIRDPRTLALSVSRMPYGSSVDLPNCWVNEAWHRKAAAFGDRLLRVKLEDLQDDPRGEMERVLDFVGEEWNEAVLDHPNHMPDPGHLPDMPWFKAPERPVQPQADPTAGLSPERIRVVEWLCRRTMKEHGYQPADLADPPGRVRVLREYVGQLPETIRYGRRVARLQRSFRDVGAWSLEHPGTRRRIEGLNPECWKHYPGYAWPHPPDPIEFDVFPTEQTG